MHREGFNADDAFQGQTCVAHFSTLAKSACVNLKPIRVLWQKYRYTYIYKDTADHRYGMTLRLHSQAARARSAQSKREPGCTGLQAQTCHAGGSCLSSLVTSACRQKHLHTNCFMSACLQLQRQMGIAPAAIAHAAKQKADLCCR